MLEFSNLFSGEPAELALLSTFQFDPDYFERRLLLGSSLPDHGFRSIRLDPFSRTRWNGDFGRHGPADDLERHGEPRLEDNFAGIREFQPGDPGRQDFPNLLRRVRL